MLIGRSARNNYPWPSDAQIQMALSIDCWLIGGSSALLAVDRRATCCRMRLQLYLVARRLKQPRIRVVAYFSNYQAHHDAAGQSNLPKGWRSLLKSKVRRCQCELLIIFSRDSNDNVT